VGATGLIPALRTVTCDVAYHTNKEYKLLDSTTATVSRALLHATLFQVRAAADNRCAHAYTQYCDLAVAAQGIASLAVPAVIIHTVVHQTSKICKKVTNPMVKKWGPVVRQNPRRTPTTERVCL
jgi:hypothetical protein